MGLGDQAWDCIHCHLGRVQSADGAGGRSVHRELARMVAAARRRSDTELGGVRIYERVGHSGAGADRVDVVGGAGLERIIAVATAIAGWRWSCRIGGVFFLSPNDGDLSRGGRRAGGARSETQATARLPESRSVVACGW